MFKTETHLHTKESSGCGQLPAEEIIKMYSLAGYTTVFVTDHFNRHNLDKSGDIPWQDKVTRYLLGYENAKAAGEKHGVIVLFGAEVTLKCMPNDYLVYGVDRTFFDNCPDMLDMELEQFYTHAKQNGATIIQAHPLRNGVCVPTPEFVDGFEVINTNPRHENFSEDVVAIAKKHGLPVTGGSDAHRIEDVGGSGIVTDAEIRSAEDYINTVMTGNMRIIGGNVK